MSAPLYIGACEVDLLAGEVERDGRRRSVEPRVLALLAYLAENPNRVLRKQDLLAVVWAGRTVSDAAVVRTVMKARRAIGDTGEPPIIRTVPRVGYLLVDAHALVQSDVPAAALRLAVLPFENRTGDSSLDWVGVGLMSLVVHWIGTDRRLSIVDTASVLTAAEGARAAGIDAVDHVRTATGAAVAISGRVTRVGEEYELTLVGLGVDGETLRASDLGDFGPRVAQAIRARHAADASPGSGVPAFADPLAMTAFARALEALAQQRYGPAANLLRMTISLAPGHAWVELELLRALCGQRDLDGSAPIAERLLAQAERSGDTMLRAQVHFALARGHMHHAAFVEAGQHVDAGLIALGPQGAPDALALGHQLRAKIACFECDLAKAEQSLEDMRRAVERTGDRLLGMRRLAMLAHVAQLGGDLDKAADLHVRAALAARALHAQGDMVTADCNAASCLLQIGQWSDAASHVEQAFAGSSLLGDQHLLCGTILLGTFVYMVSGAPAAGQRFVQALPDESQLSPLEQQWAVLARGNQAASSGDHAAAVRLFAQALQRLRHAGNRLNESDVLPWLLYALVRCGRLDEAEAELQHVLPSAASDRLEPVHRILLHCRAAVLHARGQARQALSVLLDLLGGETVPLWRAWATLDAAWLLAEAGDGAQALHRLESLPPEIGRHAVAHAVAARSLFASGARHAAMQRHRRYLDAASGGRVQPFVASLGACYANGSEPPLAPVLPSQL